MKFSDYDNYVGDAKKRHILNCKHLVLKRRNNCIDAYFQLWWRDDIPDKKLVTFRPDETFVMHTEDISNHTRRQLYIHGAPRATASQLSPFVWQIDLANRYLYHPGEPFSMKTGIPVIERLLKDYKINKKGFEEEFKKIETRAEILWALYRMSDIQAKLLEVNQGKYDVGTQYVHNWIKGKKHSPLQVLMSIILRGGYRGLPTPNELGKIRFMKILNLYKRDIVYCKGLIERV